MNDADYFALEALSASGAKLLRKSPLHYYTDRIAKKAPTPAMIFGSAVHKLALEPDTTPYVVKTLNWASKEGKLERERLEKTGLPILSEADADRAQRIRDALWADKRVADLLTDAINEHAMLWEQHGVKAKAKADAINGRTIIDLKTTIDAAPASFQKSVAQFSYHLQAAWYLDGYAATFGKPAEEFLFVAVESQAPHAVAIYRLDHVTIAAGRREMARAAALYSDCLRTREWPGYSRDVTTLTLPAWAMPAEEWSDAA